jgi:hypothetical protein
MKYKRRLIFNYYYYYYYYLSKTNAAFAQVSHTFPNLFGSITEPECIPAVWVMFSKHKRVFLNIF